MSLRKKLGAAKAKLIRFKKAYPPIVIFALRRGGSTMTAEMISACRGVWFANEPYAVLPAHKAFELKSRLLPKAMHSHFFCLKGEDLEKFALYSHNLLRAGYPELGSCRSMKFPFGADRVCLKVLNAPWMLDWYHQNTEAQKLALLRHPAAQALSVLRQNWGFPVEAYLQRKSQLHEVFSDDQIAFAEDVMRSGDNWQIALLDWVITSHPLRRATRDQAIKVLYEDIVLDPRRFIEETLIGRLHLSDRAAMEASQSRPSGSSKMSEASTLQAILQGDREAVLNGWKSKTTKDMRRTGQAILDRFEVEEYIF